MAEGDFPDSVRSSNRNVAIILTQDWCSQWTAMRRWLGDLEREQPEGSPDVDVYELEYNRTVYGNEFMRFKETVFGNSLVPYVRFYRDGRLVGESNYIDKRGFLSFFTVG